MNSLSNSAGIQEFENIRVPTRFQNVVLIETPISINLISGDQN